MFFCRDIVVLFFYSLSMRPLKNYSGYLYNLNVIKSEYPLKTIWFSLFYHVQWTNKYTCNIPKDINTIFIPYLRFNLFIFFPSLYLLGLPLMCVCVCRFIWNVLLGVFYSLATASHIFGWTLIFHSILKPFILFIFCRPNSAYKIQVMTLALEKS